MKKALIISNTAGLITDFLENDLEILKNKGYDVDCACNTKFTGKNTQDFFEKFNIKVFHVDFPIRNLKIKSIIKSYKQIKEILKNNYSVVHCHSTIAATIGRQCTKKYRKTGTKVIYTSHGFPFYEGNNSIKAKIFYQIEKYYSKYTDAIITICNEDYKNALNMKCKNVFFMHGVGVNIESIANQNINVELYRKKLGLSPEDKVILSIGELNTNKNHQIIIKSIAELNDSNIIYIICGREVTEKGKKEELQNLADSLKVRLKFLGYRNDIAEICNVSDIGAIPSYKEGLGLSGIEMLAAGIPVVGSNRQGIKDYIKDGNTGYLADPDDVSSFEKAIDETLTLKMNKNTRKKCIDMAKKFNVNQAYNVILNAYNKIL